MLGLVGTCKSSTLNTIAGVRYQWCPVQIDGDNKDNADYSDDSDDEHDIQYQVFIVNLFINVLLFFF